MDMSQFIIAKSDQLNSDDLTTGPRTVRITGVRGVDGDQPVAVSFEGDNGKPYKPCKSMRRVMVHVWGKYADKYVGQSMTLYCDPEVMFGGMKVGGIRISHMSGLTAKKTVALNTTRGKKGLYTVLPLTDAPPAQQEEEFGLPNAEAAMQAAAMLGTAELENAWKAKGMAPFREQLQPKLDGWKATAAEADFRRSADPMHTQDNGGSAYDGA